MTTFRQLEAFVGLSDTGSISAAARMLDIAQSAASTQVSELEALFSKPLLDRSGRSPTCTVDGAEVLMQARAILARRDSLLFALSSKQLPMRQLRLGVTEVISHTWLNRLLASLKGEFPKTDVQLKVDVSQKLRDELRAGDLDAVIVADVEHSYGFFKKKLGSVQNHWYCNPHLVHDRRSLRHADLSEFTLLTSSPRTRSGASLEKWLQDTGIAPRSIITSSSLLAILDLMVSGLGIAELPEPFVRELVDRGQIARMQVRPKSRPVDYVLLFREGMSTKVHKRLIEITLEACDFSCRATELPIKAALPRRSPT